MPELPEVETVRRGLEPLIVGRVIRGCTIREKRLRWPIDPSLPDIMRGQQVMTLKRRGKYLLAQLDRGALIIHLGMSGSLRYLDWPEEPLVHDHVDVEFDGGGSIRYNDPRRFGSWHFAVDPMKHRLIRGLGPEPLGPGFSADYLHRIGRHRRVAIKPFIMNSRIVVGVGNIYANEALHRAGIHPLRAAGRISLGRCERLVTEIRGVLGEAIEHGGTTLRDFVNGEGKPGYFKQSLAVYGRSGGQCRGCGNAIRSIVVGQRATYYCTTCQR